jgi:hypothetical protein
MLADRKLTHLHLELLGEFGSVRVGAVRAFAMTVSALLFLVLSGYGLGEKVGEVRVGIR